MLEIRNLHAVVEGEELEILKGVNLTVNKGEIHAIMGPNGSGKSTLSKVVSGHPEYEVTEGTILFEGEDITEMDADERAHLGLFLAFQYPVEVPGITNKTLLRGFPATTSTSLPSTSVETEYSQRVPGRQRSGIDAQSFVIASKEPEFRLPEKSTPAA